MSYVSSGGTFSLGNSWINNNVIGDTGGAINLNNTVRTGTTTHGKQIGVKYIIKGL